MNTKTAFSFAAKNARHDHDFLSFREAIEKLAAYTGETFYEVARTLKVFDFDERHCARIAGSHKKIYPEISGRYVSALLTHVITRREVGTAELPEDADFQEEDPTPDENGWYRARFLEMLRDNEIDCPDSLRLADETIPNKSAATLVAENAAHVESTASEIEALKSTLASAQAEVSRLSALAPPVQSPMLALVTLVQREFWVDWNESKPRPKSEVIKGWLMDRYPDIASSDVIASAIEKVACPVNRTRGGNK